MRKTTVLALMGLAMTAHTLNAADIPLADKERALAVIQTAPTPHADESLAANELSTYLEAITGKKFPVVTNDAAAPTVIQVGRSFGQPVETALAKVASSPDGFVLDAKPGKIILAGTTPEGTLFAAYEFLERLGCRWFIPGKLGEVVPRSETLSFPVGRVEQTPSFVSRHLQSHNQKDPWYRRQRLSGPTFPSAHSGSVLLPADKYFQEHPEYFGLVDKKRQSRQLCYSSEEGTREAAKNLIAYIKKRKAGAPQWVGIGPNDGGGFCRCEKCMAQYVEWDPYSNEWSITDAFLAWANRLVELVLVEVPDAKFGFYIYHTYNLPPRNVKPHPAISGALAPISYCRVHGIRNPICDEAHSYRRLIDGWGAIMPDLYQRGYGFQLASPQFLWSRVHVWRDEVPYAKLHGIKGWRVESPPSWANDPVTHWVFCKLMWNADAGVDALVDDFHRNFYGPAAVPAKAFWQLVDTRLRDGDFHAGNAWDEPRFFPPEVMQQLDQHLKTAESLAPKDSIYATRVRLLRLAWERANAFLTMRAEHDRGKFADAKAALDRCDALTKDLVAFDPPMIEPSMSKNYMNRFWRKSVESAYERNREGNRVLAVLPDAWRFRMDPQGVGLLQDWFDTSIRDDGWQTIRTLSGTWSDQGLRYYKGAAWYRTTVTLPDKHDGKVMLWFGAVDEDATIWINGKEAGKKPDKNPNNPFELDVTSAIQPGKPNLVAVRVMNERVNELGTGGIMKTVMFYTTKASQPKSDTPNEAPQDGF